MEEMFGNFRVLLIYLSRLIVTLLTDTITGHSFTRADEPCRRGGGRDVQALNPRLKRSSLHLVCL